MADLIIQPKNDDHLKLNNDAGTTILELVNDESKLRLAQNNISASDGTTAITTSSANVTLAGTANNIGTVSAGTLGNAVIHPAGRILQVKQSYLTSETSLGNNSYTSTGLTVSIDGSAVADSTFIIFATFTIGEVTGTSAGFSFRLSRNGSAIANTNTDFITKVQSTNPNSYTESIALSAKEAPGSTNGTTYIYRVDFKRTTAGSGTCVINPSTNMSTITVFEVAGQST